MWNSWGLSQVSTLCFETPAVSIFDYYAVVQVTAPLWRIFSAGMHMHDVQCNG